ncbi:Adenosine kinase [Hondaea fermentalgiana]|uniref:Adenosine kinase n=1 Tax=Hondaea fermentalgiana TaxID=2315210 RepID=A0A2R5GJ25_9STRA|nr:Adenosine kinase [Hondaea fermentalgiana]|eukprot:GBG30319.1 Adenosine kinase [Hondaea fermentalgiana]
MNGEELAAYAKQAKWDQDAPQSSHARSLAGLLSSSGLVFVTNGAQSTVVAQQDVSMDFSVPKVSHVEGDTTGAGDSFAGGVLACILLARQNTTLKQHLASIDLQGSLIAEAVAKGTALAGASLQHQGIEE